MKRIAVLLCLLALLLTGCTRTEQPETSAAPSAEAAQTDAPTERPARTTTAVLTEPPAQASDEAPAAPETEPPRTEPDESESRNEGSRTAGGVLVWTDPSAYRPYGGFGAKYTRLREGPLDRFEPSEDYGAVYPYAAAVFYKWGFDAENDPEYLYGLADRNGRILTDGIYRDVAPLCDSNSDPIVPAAYWEVTRAVGIEEQTVEYSEWTEDVSGVDYRRGLISMDGSFALDCVYTRIYETGNGILCQGEGGASDFTVYNADWEPILTGAQVVGDGDYDWIGLEYGDGLYLVTTYTSYYDEETDWYRSKKLCWYCDGSGERVLGPYYDAEPFYEGRARVSTDPEVGIGDDRGYIDKTGAPCGAPAETRPEENRYLYWNRYWALPAPETLAANDQEDGLPIGDPIRGELWAFTWNGTAWEGRGETGSSFTAPRQATRINPLGGLFYVQTEDASLLLGYDGETILRYPIDQGD